MPSLRKPTVVSIRRFLAGQAELPFSYSAVGATAESPPAGFVVDRTRIKLGDGESVFGDISFSPLATIRIPPSSCQFVTTGSASLSVGFFAPFAVSNR